MLKQLLEKKEQEGKAFRWRIGIDPGASTTSPGGISVFNGDEIIKLYDIPVKEKKIGKGVEVDTVELSSIFNEIICMRDGKPTSFRFNLEYVNAMPRKGKDGKKVKMGAQSMFSFGESTGAIKGVIGAMGVEPVLVMPGNWKRSFGLAGLDKDASRQLAIKYFPYLKEELKLKKHHGRADAIFLSLAG